MPEILLDTHHSESPEASAFWLTGISQQHRSCLRERARRMNSVLDDDFLALCDRFRSLSNDSNDRLHCGETLGEEVNVRPSCPCLVAISFEVKHNLDLPPVGIYQLEDFPGDFAEITFSRQDSVEQTSESLATVLQLLRVSKVTDTDNSSNRPMAVISVCYE